MANELCENCEHWEPPVTPAHPKSAAGMGYGVCWEITGASIECAGPPPAMTDFENVDLLTLGDFGCNQFHEKT